MPGTAVTINGTNFDPNLLNDRIRVNVSAALPASATPTSIATTAPPVFTSGRVTVVTPAGIAVSSQDLFVPFLAHVITDVAYTGRSAFGSNQTVALPAGKIGLLLFDATAGQRVSLNLTSSTYPTSCSLYLFAPDGSQMLRWSLATLAIPYPSPVIPGK
ncbi:MAG: IPT/TIG domain-containing protein [Acidobacteriia bacterium]|nr:IPT/TIG domain-containing protein [Terriglobia bacterium]